MDKVIRALIEGGDVSLTVIQNTQMVQTAANTHFLTNLGIATLGRILTAVTYLSACLKDESGQVSVTFKGNGEGGDICVSGNYDLSIRGAIDNPYVYLPPKPNGEEDVEGAIGRSGSMTVVRDDGYSTPFVGTCELKTGDVGDEFARYFALSEQLPTAFFLVTIPDDENCVYSGGIIVQPMPGAREESVERVTDLLSKTDLRDKLTAMDAEEVVKKVFGAESYTVRNPLYRCTCSREYLRDILRSFGEAELRDILAKEKRICVHCHFCNTDYAFYEEDVDEMFGKRKETWESNDSNSTEKNC
ncbi:MAG: Hsp33 family molecular chaperone HslO [Clostridia bacterium]|nr:Hsp33 family molecular chaperone HslO [Clostridia bacterium]